LNLALVQVFQADRDPVNEIFASSRALRSTAAAATEESTATATKELGEQVVAVHAAHSAGSAAFEACFTIRVVAVAG
jgi:hypothetical protein